MPSYRNGDVALIDRKSYTARRKFQSGMTLIEVMITIVVLSILVLGISGLWANVTGDFLALTTRQKAIFVLNGEMARLSALFRFAQTNQSITANSGNYRNIGDIAPVNRTIFLADDSDLVNKIVVTSNDGTFNCGDNNCAGNVLRIENAFGSGGPRNYVWIDQSRNIVGELSWRLVREALPPGAALCAGQGCSELTVYLRFPLRYINDTTAAEPPEFGRVETLSLITIVGQRP